MNMHFFSTTKPARTLACGLIACGLLASVAFAGPGSHGPNGEHLDQAALGASASVRGPRFEAQSELFELVATLGGGELSILIDRFASNEPLLKADVEVESGAIKAKARFHADMGDFSVADPAMLKLLATPGEHPLLITIVAGAESDLLDGVLRTAAAANADAELDHDALYGHSKSWLPTWARWLAGAAVLLAILGWAWRRKAQQRGKFAGEQA